MNNIENVSEVNIDLTNNTHDIEKFIYKNTEYYIKNFEKMNDTSNKITWNWSAFFFSGFWMLYRKMHMNALIFIISCMLLSSVPIIGLFSPFIVSVLLGMYGNAIYLKHIETQLSEINKSEASKKELLIMKKGGTDLVFPLTAAGVLVVFFVMNFLLMIALGVLQLLMIALGVLQLLIRAFCPS